MPAYLAWYETNGDPGEDIVITDLSGGQTSATYTKELWNDKALAELDAETSRDQLLILLAATGTNPFISGGATLDYPTGLPVLEERWARVRIVKYLTQAGETDDYTTDTVPFGTNAALPLPDLAPGTGIRVEFKVIAPAGQTASAVKLKLRAVGNQAGSPLSQMVTLAQGSGVIPADRVSGYRGLLRGGVVTANDTATVSIAAWLQAYDGTETMKLDATAVMTLADGDAVDLLTGESYLVTLSITSAGAVTVTKGPKAELVNYPSKPAADIFLAHLTVESPDGIVVTVAQSDVDQSGVKYGEFWATDAGGLTLRVWGGDGVTGSDFRQWKDNSVDITLTASETNRVWRLAAGLWTATVTDVPTEFNADLVWLVPTDASAIMEIVDARVFLHRAITMERIELRYQAALSQLTIPAQAVALAYAYDDCEIEEVEENLSGVDGTWTAGEVKIDILTLAPGAATPFPAGGAGGTSIFTSSGTDDRRPTIAYNATNLRVVTRDHEVRRIVRGTRILMSVVAKPTAPGAEPEQEVLATLHVRRYR